MIRYRLVCTEKKRAHEFEAWFKSSDDYERQAKGKLVLCPTCGSAKVEKALMAPSVVTTKGKRRAVPGSAPEAAAPAEATGETSPPAPSAPMPVATLTPEQRAFVEVMRKVREHVLASSEDVGKKFAEEARKIHYDEAEKRGIRGEASLEEAKELLEEGIEVYPLPPLPEDRN
jgi:hypothetical protein